MRKLRLRETRVVARPRRTQAPEADLKLRCSSSRAFLNDRSHRAKELDSYFLSLYIFWIFITVYMSHTDGTGQEARSQVLWLTVSSILQRMDLTRMVSERSKEQQTVSPAEWKERCS